MQSFSTQELQEFSALVGTIYDGALDMGSWQQLPHRISQWMRTPYATLFTPLNTPDQGGFMLTDNITPQAIALWATRYHAKDPWAERAAALGRTHTGVITRDQDLLSVEEFTTTAMYQEFFQPLGIGRLLTGGVFGLDQSHHLPTVCSLNRALDDPFTEADATKFSLLLPHLSRALGMMFRLRDAEFRVSSSLATLDCLRRAVLLLNEHGRVSFANTAALRLLRLDDGLALRAHGRAGDELVTTHQPGEQARLNAAIAGAVSPDLLHAAHFVSALTVQRPSGQPAFALRFSTLPSHNEFGHGSGCPRAIAFVNDGQVELQLNPEVLRQAYQLTPAEIRLAELAADGDSVDELARQLGLAVNTVKSQLKHVYEKTGTHNRAKLTRLLLSLSDT